MQKIQTKYLNWFILSPPDSGLSILSGLVTIQPTVSCAEASNLVAMNEHIGNYNSDVLEGIKSKQTISNGQK
jgi:hypothetical protein